MNTVEVVFPDHVHTADALSPLWQWDYGQRLIISGLQLPASYEVHFCNAGDEGTKAKVGDANGVAIPDEYLRDGRNIHAFIYLHAGETDGETVYMIKIKVKPRPRPTDLFPSEEQETALDYAIKRLTEFSEATREVDTEPIRGSTNIVTSGGVYAALDGKVDKSDGKDLSTNDFTDAYKQQLDGLDDALANLQESLTIDDIPMAGSDNLVTSGGVHTALAEKQDTVSGKGLSTNDFTDAEKTKLANAVTQSELTEALSDVVTSDTLSDTMNDHVPDWSDNDGDNGYIRNRTHYTTHSLGSPILETSIGTVSSIGSEALIIANMSGEIRYPLAARVQKSSNYCVMTSESYEVNYRGQRQVVCNHHYNTSGNDVYELRAYELGIYIKETAQEFKIYAAVGTRAGTVKVSEFYGETVTKLDNKYLDLSTSPDAQDTKPITSSAVASALDGKVDKVSGMGLSHNDFSDSDRAKLADAVSQDDLAAALSNVQSGLTFDDTPTENSGNPVTSDGVYTAIHALATRIEALNTIINLMVGGSNSAVILDDYLVLVGDQYVDQDDYLVIPSASVESDYLII